MGYYTDFQIEIKSNKEYDLQQVVEKLETISGYEFYEYDGIIIVQEAKWYNHEKDMLKLSKCFPDLLFVIDGVGEEKRDMWKGYVRNGQHEYIRAEITYADSDIEKSYEFDISVEEVLSEPPKKKATKKVSKKTAKKTTKRKK